MSEKVTQINEKKDTSSIPDINVTKQGITSKNSANYFPFDNIEVSFQ